MCYRRVVQRAIIGEILLMLLSIILFIYIILRSYDHYSTHVALVTGFLTLILCATFINYL